MNAPSFPDFLHESNYTDRLPRGKVRLFNNPLVLLVICCISLFWAMPTATGQTPCGILNPIETPTFNPFCGSNTVSDYIPPPPTQ